MSFLTPLFIFIFLLQLQTEVVWGKNNGEDDDENHSCPNGWVYDQFLHACKEKSNNSPNNNPNNPTVTTPSPASSPLAAPPVPQNSNSEVTGSQTKNSAYSTNLKLNAGKMDAFKNVFNNNVQVPTLFQNTSLTQEQMINLRNCFHGIEGFTCKAGITSVYPQVSENCGTNGKCDGSKVKIEGCYTQNFQRGQGTDGEIPKNTGKCENQNFPFRVTVLGKTGCSSNAGACTKGSYIDVTIQIFDDHIPEQSVEFSALTKITTRVSSQATGDPLRVSCAMLAPDGYEWDDEVGKCVRPTQNICEMLNLPFVKETNSKKKSKNTAVNPHGHCVAQNVDCRTAFPTQNICNEDEKHCKGTRYSMKSAGGVSCLCTGSSTTLDGVKRACFDDPTNVIPKDIKTFSVLLFENPKDPEYKRDAPNNDIWKRYSGPKDTLSPEGISKEGPTP